MSDVSRLGNRVRLMVARAVLAVVNDAAKLQAVQVELQAGVVRDQAEHFQHYGFTSHALPGAEGIGLSIGGSTDHLVVINVDDRRYRLSLESGEVALYDDLGHKVHLTRDGIVIDGAGHVVRVTNLEKLQVDADIESTGDIRAAGNVLDQGGGAGQSMADMRNTFNGHDHPETGATTLHPNQQM